MEQVCVMHQPKPAMRRLPQYQSVRRFIYTANQATILFLDTFRTIAPFADQPIGMENPARTAYLFQCPRYTFPYLLSDRRQGNQLRHHDVVIVQPTIVGNKPLALCIVNEKIDQLFSDTVTRYDFTYIRKVLISFQAEYLEPVFLLNPNPLLMI